MCPQDELAPYLKFLQYNMTAVAKAMRLDQSSLMQQTVCNFERAGTFHIANGFSVRCYSLLLGFARNTPGDEYSVDE